MLPAGRRCGSEWIQRYCVVFTCLTAGLLTARVSADLPFDLHSDPCGTWPDLDIDAPCKCDVCLKSGRDAAEKGNKINVAFNRPTSLSSTGTCNFDQYLCYCDKNEGQLLPCGAVNGALFSYLSNGCHKQQRFYNGIMTKFEDHKAWMIVDFQRPYTISYIALKIGSDPKSGIGLKLSESYQRWANVYESVDAQLCHTWPSYHKRNEISDPRYKNDIVIIQCDRPVRGSRYRIQKIHVPNDWCPFPQNCGFLYGWEIFMVGELQVWVCKSGFYGHPTKDGGCDNKCPSACSTFCDNYYGCVTQHTKISHNIAIGRPVCASKIPGQLDCNNQGSSKTVDGGGVSYMRHDWCYWSGVGGTGFHNIRIELDGGYFVTHVKLDTVTGDEQKIYKFRVLVRMVSSVHQYDGSEVCGEIYGTPDQDYLYTINCRSCSAQLSDCPRGRYVTVKELTQSHVNLCEIQVFGVAFKEDSKCRDCDFLVCKNSEVCVSGKCRVQLGGACTSDEDCQDQSKQQCSDISKTCRLRLGETCSQQENLCYERLLCDPSGGKCSLRHSDNCTGHAQHCFHGLVCDVNCECRKKVGDGCSANTDCVAGAVCQGSQCQCSKLADTDRNRLCQPKADNPECTSPLKRGQDFSCRVDVGQGPCDTTDNRCDDGAQCVNKCQPNDNAPCNPTGPAEQCGENRTCDPVILQCRVKEGKPCSDTSPCVQGTTCQTSKTGQKVCHIQPLGDCSNNTDYCVAGYVCPVEGSKVCMVGNGEPCDDYVDTLRCAPGSVCLAMAKGDNRCMLDIGAACTAQLKCRPGAVCIKERCAWNVAQPCKQDECAEGLTCDLDGICRITRGGDCSKFSGYCQLRASCVQGTCKCVESVAEDDVGCPLKTGITGIPTSPCKVCEEADTSCIQCTGSASCHNDTCVCINKLVLAADLTCKPDIGSSCSNISTSTEDIICAKSAICETNHCAIPPGQPCSGSTWFNCMSGSVCDDSVCRLDVNVDCSGDRAGLCIHGWVCDAATHKCKMPVCAVPFSSCQGNELESPCISGAMCNETDGQCYCQASLSTKQDCKCQAKEGLVAGDCSGGSCTDQSAICKENKCVCKPGYELSPVDLTCKKAEGEKCTTSDSCAPGKQCDTKTSTCKRKVGSYCNSSKTDAESECTHDAYCESGTCRLEINADCSNSPPYSCTAYSFCETGVSNRCKSFQNAPCNYTATPNTCLSGAQCVQGLCQCDTTVTKAKGVKCEALAGMVSGACLLGENCQTVGAVCVDKVCSCPQGTETNFQLLSCHVQRHEASREVRSHNVYAIAAGAIAIVASCLLFALLAVRIKARDQKLEALKAELAVRKAEQERFQGAVFEVTKLTEPVGKDSESSADLEDHVKEAETVKEARAVTVKEGETLKGAVTLEEPQAVTVKEGETVKGAVTLEEPQVAQERAALECQYCYPALCEHFFSF